MDKFEAGYSFWKRKLREIRIRLSNPLTDWQRLKARQELETAQLKLKHLKEQEQFEK